MTEESKIVTVQMDADVPMERQSGLVCAAYSEPGGRASQQDSLFCGERDGMLLAAVCDGMGGMNGGEIASGIAARLFAEAFYTQELPDAAGFLEEMAHKADEAVFGLTENGKPMGAGSTIVSVLIRGRGLHWLSVGDSRIYLFRRGELLCPVRPHNYGELLRTRLAEGKISQEAYKAGLKNAEALISFLGIGGLKLIELNRQPFWLEDGDQVLLCSDGLYRSLSEERIRELLMSGTAPSVLAKKLVQEAVEVGGSRQDNTSVVLIRCEFARKGPETEREP